MRRFTAAAVVLAFALLAACGGGGATKDAGRARFLLVVHSPMAGTISTRSDTDLVAMGNQACAALASGRTSDDVVTSMSADALPGSAAYNAYSFLVVSAATDLCPSQAGQFKGTIPTGP